MGSVLWCSSVWDYLSHYERAHGLRGGGAGTESMLAGGLEVYLIAKYVRLRVLVSSLPLQVVARLCMQLCSTQFSKTLLLPVTMRSDQQNIGCYISELNPQYMLS